MGIFSGTYDHAIDAKGRVALPARWRADLGARVVVSRGLDGGCLFVWRPDDWEAFVGRELDRHSVFSKEARAVNRYLRGSAHDLEIDGQGRILLPSALRTAAGIDGKIVFLGVGDRIEAWAPDRWAAYQAQTAEAIEAVADRLWREQGV